MANYNIQAAAQLSGISDACIRAWEKRYNSITPARNESNHRLYSEADIERLTLFNKLTSIGMRISQLSVLETEELKKIYLSVSKKDFDKVELETKKSGITYFQSLYIIEESFNAKRFEVAFHEVKKVVETSDVRELALKFFPSLEGLCHAWKEKHSIDHDEIKSFEKYITNLASKKAHREDDCLRDVRSLSLSLTSHKNQIMDSGLNLLLAAHRIENSQYSNENCSSFLINLVKTTKPKFIFLVGERSDPEIMKVVEAISPLDTSKVIIFDQSISLLKSKIAGNEDTKVLSSIFEIDKFLETTLQA